jgi:hypothetical protein
MQSILDHIVMLLTALFVHLSLLRCWSNCLDQISSWSTSVIKTYNVLGSAWTFVLISSTNELLSRIVSIEFSSINSLRYTNTMQILYAIIPFKLAVPEQLRFDQEPVKRIAKGYIKSSGLSKSTLSLALLLKK